MLMLRYIRKHIFVFVTAAVLSVLGWGMMTGAVVFRQILIDHIVTGETSLFMRYLIFMGVFVVFMAAIYYAGGLLGQKFNEKFLTSIRNDVYKGIMKRNRVDFESKDTAQYMSNIQNDPERIVGTLNMISGMTIGMLVAGAVSFVIMLIYSPLLTFIAIAATLTGLVMPICFSGPMAKRQVEISEKSEEFTVQMKEIFAGWEVVSSFNLFKNFASLFNNKNKGLARAKYEFGKLTSGTQSISHMSSQFTTVVVFVAAGLMAINGSITIGTLVLFLSSAPSLSGSAGAFMQMLPFIKGIKPIAAKLEEIIGYEDSTFSGTSAPTFNKAVEIKNLSFAYDNTRVLKSVGMAIRKNEKIAVTGPSGCGKTTLMKLLRGEYYNYDGEIYYDGVELKQLAVGELHKIMTVIHQNVYLFNESIRYNICLGEEFSDAELSKALKLSGAEKFLPDIEGGLEGGCGEKGANLSGGQRQRIAIARALIRGVKFIVLDEGVSAIDIETANEIEQELLNIKELTLITITHRIKDGLLGSYDRVIEMANQIETTNQKGGHEMPNNNQTIESNEKKPEIEMITLMPGQSIADVLAELQKKHGGEIKMMTAGSLEEAQKMVSGMEKKAG